MQKILTILLFLSALLLTQGASARPLKALDTRQVEVGGEMGRRIDITVENNLLVVDVDKDFLKPFQDRNKEDGYIGLGKFIDSLSRLAAHTQNKALIERKEHVVDTILATQEADGYIGLMKAEARVYKLWDLHEMAYLVLGLTTDYHYFKKEASLAGAEKLADYILSRVKDIPPAAIKTDITQSMPATGLEEALLWLYEHDKKQCYFDLAGSYRDLYHWDAPITLGRWGDVAGHAYAHTGICLSQLRLDPTWSTPALLEPSKKVMAFLLKGEGLVISGTCGDHECWHNTQAGTTNLGETCTTVYLLKFWDEMLRHTGNTLYGDLMERAILNALFAAQSPDGRRIRYYSPFEAPRKFHEVDTYCCPCNYRRAIAALPEWIYYQREDGLAINLYSASRVETELKEGIELSLRQITDYPNSGTVTILVNPEKEATFSVYYRVPRWAHSHRCTVNGEAIESEVGEDGLHRLKRSWKGGDKIELNFPMDWRLVQGRVNQAGKAALMRGPQLFGLSEASNEAMKDLDPRLLTLDPKSIQGPMTDTTVRPDGMACTIKLWDTGSWYPHAKPGRELRLTEFAAPALVHSYFHVPNPKDAALLADELMGLEAPF